MSEQQRSGRVYHRAAKPRKSASRTFGESAEWSDHQGCEALYTNKPLDLIRSLRPWQWVKNLLVCAVPALAFISTARPAFFTRGLLAVSAPLAWTFGMWCLLSSAAYILNDLADARYDRGNPLRKQRPIAARKVSTGAVGILLVLCLFGAGGFLVLLTRCGCQASEALPPLHVGWVPWLALAYLLIQPLYTFGKRAFPEVGAALLAAGFVLRALSGAASVGAEISSWFLVCIFLAALFVALCKRRSAHFVRSLPQPTAADARILDLEIGLCAAATLACYAFYVCAPETRQHMGSPYLVWTIPCVLFGLFRYLRLTYGERRGGNPETAFLCDLPMLLLLLLWAGLFFGLVWMNSSCAS